MCIIHIIPAFKLAGAEVMAEQLCIRLKEQGAEVSVISLYDYRSRLTKQMEQAGIKIYYLHKKRGPDLRMIPRMAAIFKKRQPDIVHTHLYSMQYAMPAALLANVPRVVHTVHSVADMELSPAKQKLQAFFYHFCGARPVAVSPRVRRSAMRLYRLRPYDIPVIPNGIDLPIPYKKETYSLGKEIKIIHVGRFDAAKNHHALIDAFSFLKGTVPNAKLYLVGDGPLASEIRQVIREKSLEDSVILCGVLEDVYPVMVESDIFVLPSKWEGMPMTIIEAMACGMPIVASGTGGAGDMISNGKNGFLCLPVPDSIALALQKMIESESLRRRCGKQARHDSARYSSRRMAENYLEFYNSILP